MKTTDNAGGTNSWFPQHPLASQKLLSGHWASGGAQLAFSSSMI